MRCLLDEDVPVKLLRALTAASHEAVRAIPSTPDPAVAAQAVADGRILITLDKDFTDKALYPPTRFTIVHIRSHPPYAEDIVEAVMGLLAQRSPEQCKGLIALGRAGSIRVPE